MAKLRITKPGELPNKKKFKRNVKIKKYANRALIGLFILYVIYKENLISFLQ